MTKKERKQSKRKQEASEAPEGGRAKKRTYEEVKAAEYISDGRTTKGEWEADGERVEVDLMVGDEPRKERKMRWDDRGKRYIEMIKGESGRF